VYHLRRTFELQSVPRTFVVHASGDQRYQLFVNGTRVLVGPSRGDLNHWRFETADVVRWLRPGRNVLAAVLWNFADAAPMAQVSHQTGFVLQGDTDAEAVVNTGKSWRSVRNDAFSLLPIDRAAIFYEYFVSGPGEVIDAVRYPWGWAAVEYDDGDWAGVEPIVIAAPRGIRDTPSRWMLVPRTIPAMEAAEDRFARVARAEGVTLTDGFTGGTSPLVVPARTTATLLLDRGHLTTAYPEFVITGGHGASLTVTYAEALRQALPNGSKGPKGNRNDVEGKIIRGLQDRFLPDGGAGRLFRPLWWRTYRYVQVEVQTGDEALTLDDVRGELTAYPFEERARFESSDPSLATIWEIGWRTARVCANETYMDTPYWEQLQYVGDTRIQALISYYVAGDDRLAKQAIQLYDESRITDGLTQSRYPTELPQIIPPFSLFWIGMMHDLYAWGGDREFLRPYVRGAAGVLDWYADRLLPSGLLGRMEWWNFTDWVDGHGFQSGEAPVTSSGESAIISLQFAMALRQAAALEQAFGRPDHVTRYRTLADRIVDGVRRAVWDEARGVFADTPAKTTYSQHVNLLAVLADVVPMAEQQAFMRRVLQDGSLTKATYYFQFYLFEAMRKAGLGDEYLDQLGPWRTMIDLGLTTWAEKPEPTRSDSHAWSAHPNYHLLTLVAGVEAATPGFGTVRIEPHLGHLTHARASVATPKGLVHVRYVRAGESLDAEVTLPQDVTGTFVWKGRETTLKGGTQRIAP
jgi:alpha-L-rhamnosidase